MKAVSVFIGPQCREDVVWVEISEWRNQDSDGVSGLSIVTLVDQVNQFGFSRRYWQLAQVERNANLLGHHSLLVRQILHRRVVTDHNRDKFWLPRQLCHRLLGFAQYFVSQHLAVNQLSSRRSSNHRVITSL